MPLAIRSAEDCDEAAVTSLWHACDLVVPTNDPATDFRFARRGPNAAVLVGTLESRIVGSVMVGHDGHRGWLYYVAADPACRGQGIGRQMVEAGEDWLRRRGVPKVQLLVRETNRKVTSFYAHIGYEVAPRIIMSKWLPGTRQDGTGKNTPDIKL